MSSLVLFSTEGCHLCEDAQVLLANTSADFNVADIMERQEWLDSYKIRIPVLRHSDSGQELDWPFDAEQLQQFLENIIGTS